MYPARVGSIPTRGPKFVVGVFEWHQKTDCDSVHAGSNPVAHPNGREAVALVRSPKPRPVSSTLTAVAMFVLFDN